MKISAHDKNRLSYINFTMSEINDLSSEIYEHLVDNENEELLQTIDKMMSVLIDLKKSTRDEE